jgi:uncharacterized protein YjbI with pentapeptide repeats
MIDYSYNPSKYTSVALDEFSDAIQRREDYLEKEKKTLTDDMNAFRESQVALVTEHVKGGIIENRNLSASFFNLVWFQDMTFINCDFRSSYIHYCLAENCKFLNCNFGGSEIFDGCFVRADFTGSSFIRADIQRCIFTYANLTNVSVYMSGFSNSDLRYALLENMAVEGSGWVDVQLHITSKFKAKRPEVFFAKDLDIHTINGHQKYSGMEALEQIFNFADEA